MELNGMENGDDEEQEKNNSSEEEKMQCVMEYLWQKLVHQVSRRREAPLQFGARQ